MLWRSSRRVVAAAACFAPVAPVTSVVVVVVVVSIYASTFIVCRFRTSSLFRSRSCAKLWTRLSEDLVECTQALGVDEHRVQIINYFSTIRWLQGQRSATHKLRLVGVIDSGIGLGFQEGT